MSELRTAYIGLGANLGDRLTTLRQAVSRLTDLGEVTRVSSLYETAPVGYLDQPSFLNAVAEVRTSLDATPLVRALLGIEADLGRERSYRNAPRTLDLDLLLVGDDVVESDDAHVPHPRLQQRLFVLAPLADLVPDMRHPVLGQTMAQLRDALENDGGVSLVDGPIWVNLPAGDAGTIVGRSGSLSSG